MQCFLTFFYRKLSSEQKRTLWSGKKLNLVMLQINYKMYYHIGSFQFFEIILYKSILQRSIIYSEVVRLQRTPDGFKNVMLVMLSRHCNSILSVSSFLVAGVDAKWTSIHAPLQTHSSFSEISIFQVSQKTLCACE